VRVQLAATNYLSLAEVQVWTGSSTPPVQWLISDHLGTPRMVLDQTGSLANMKRHDYLPFGEELVAPTSGRSAAQGYAGGDGVRQQFTEKERDTETGLDYFGARYFASTQGRFTSPGEPFADQSEGDPQTWNLYSYTANNPLARVDPDGRRWFYKDIYDEDGKLINGSTLIMMARIRPLVQGGWSLFQPSKGARSVPVSMGYLGRATGSPM
jgi:RHS repeat-associated protein